MKALSSVEVASFLLIATTWGFCVGTIEGYLFLFLDDLGASEVLLGLSLTFTCLAEVPVFHYMDRILRVLGENVLVSLVSLAFMVRLSVYRMLGEQIHNLWLVLPVELLHGITFGCAWAVGCLIMKREAPQGLQSTFQGIYQGVYFGVAHGVGGLTGGILYEKHGPRSVFMAGQLVVLTGWVVFALMRSQAACCR